MSSKSITKISFLALIVCVSFSLFFLRIQTDPPSSKSGVVPVDLVEDVKFEVTQEEVSDIREEIDELKRAFYEDSNNFPKSR